MPNYVAKQISGYDDKGKCALAVVVKQTYNIDKSGKCFLADEQLPLNEKLTYYAHNKSLLEADSDLCIKKFKCDVVVKGKARCYGNAKQFAAHVILGNIKHTIAVQGNQKVFLDSYGKLHFSEINEIDEVPLRYDFAYGGKDIEAEKKIQPPPAEILAAMPNLDYYADSPFRYPRNTEGKGYLVEKSKNMVELLELPNLQDPEHLLTPDNILVENVNRWIEMPLPYATDWVSHVWVPRLIYTGLIEFPAERTALLKELKKKWVEPDIYSKKEPSTSFNYRFFNGAHYALQIDFINNVRECTLMNIHPLQQKFTINLPVAKPKIWVDGRKGTLKETKSVMHSILIEPDDSKLSIVWCGSAPALRPYYEEELKTMPFKVEWGK